MKLDAGYGSLGYIESDPPSGFELQTDSALEGDDDWLDAVRSDDCDAAQLSDALPRIRWARY